MVTADELCDRVAFLVDGRITTLDAPRTLRLPHGHRAVRIETMCGTTREFALDSLDENPQFLALLHTGVETVHTLETTLKDVYVQVTEDRWHDSVRLGASMGPHPADAAWILLGDCLRDPDR
jgi:fluoroquinolone transport system ATP-binding protein